MQSEVLTIILLFIALSIFAVLTYKARSIKTFQFQLSIFILIWIIGELVDIAFEYEYTERLLYNLELAIRTTIWTINKSVGYIIDADYVKEAFAELGLTIHTISMLFISVIVLLRYYYANRSKKQIFRD